MEGRVEVAERAASAGVFMLGVPGEEGVEGEVR